MDLGVDFVFKEMNCIQELLYEKYLAFTSVISTRNRCIMTTSAFKHLENTERIAGFCSDFQF